MAKGKCAFCNHHGKLTGEHMWPKWLHEVIPLNLKGLHHTHSTIKPKFAAFGIGASNVNEVRRSGDPGSRKLPIACSSCNNGWMSRLQQLVQPILTPIIKGHWTDLSNHAESVARWCIMTTMVFEYTDPSTIAILQGERDAIRRQDPISEGWTLWVGQCPEESPNRRAIHTAFCVADGPIKLIRSNAQATTIHVGKMLLQVVSGPMQDHGSNVIYSLEADMRLLYPNPARKLVSQPMFHHESQAEYHHERLLDFYRRLAKGERVALMPGVEY